MSHYLHIDAVTKRFGEFTALHDVSLGISRGEFVTFLGPSGSGKTTTLMIIAGFEKATAGDVRVEGRSLSAIPPHARNIGIVFQNYALFPHKTALENVCFPLQMRSVGRATAIRKAEDMLALVGLKGLGERYPKELSGGQQQRVALARALVFEPSLLLLDEPLGALDKSLREQMQIEIKRIQKSLGVTTIFVTHDQSEAMSMSDRIVVFNHGRVQQVDAPLDIYQRPNTNFVAGFVGESNLIAATVRDSGSGLVATGAFGDIALPAGKGAEDGQDVTLMVRPEAFHLVGEDGPAGFDMTVGTIVNYGDNALVMGEHASQPLRIKLMGHEAARLSEGQSVRVAWKPEAVHLIHERLSAAR